MNAFSKGMRFFNSEFFGENYLVGGGGGGLSRATCNLAYEDKGKIRFIGEDRDIPSTFTSRVKFPSNISLWSVQDSRSSCFRGREIFSTNSLFPCT